MRQLTEAHRNHKQKLHKQHKNENHKILVHGYGYAGQFVAEKLSALGIDFEEFVNNMDNYKFVFVASFEK